MWAVHGPITRAQLLHGTHGRENETVFRAHGRTFAIDGLRGRHDDLSDGQALFADNLQHLGGPEAVYENVLRDLGHVSTVSTLVEDRVDAVERRQHGRAVGKVACAKLSAVGYPRGSTESMGLGLQVIENTNPPTLAKQQICDV